MMKIIGKTLNCFTARVTLCDSAILNIALLCFAGVINFIPFIANAPYFGDGLIEVAEGACCSEFARMWMQISIYVAMPMFIDLVLDWRHFQKTRKSDQAHILARTMVLGSFTLPHAILLILMNAQPQIPSETLARFWLALVPTKISFTLGGMLLTPFRFGYKEDNSSGRSSSSGSAGTAVDSKDRKYDSGIPINPRTCYMENQKMYILITLVIGRSLSLLKTFIKEGSFVLQVLIIASTIILIAQALFFLGFSLHLLRGRMGAGFKFQSHHHLYDFWYTVVLLLYLLALIATVIAIIALADSDFSNSNYTILVSPIYNILLCFQVGCTVLLTIIPGRAHLFAARFERLKLESRLNLIRYVSHEMRTPLSTATMGLNILNSDLDHLYLLSSKLCIAATGNSPASRNPNRSRSSDDTDNDDNYSGNGPHRLRSGQQEELRRQRLITHRKPRHQNNQSPRHITAAEGVVGALFDGSFEDDSSKHNYHNNDTTTAHNTEERQSSGKLFPIISNSSSSTESNGDSVQKFPTSPSASSQPGGPVSFRSAETKDTGVTTTTVDIIGARGAAATAAVVGNNSMAGAAAGTSETTVSRAGVGSAGSGIAELDIDAAVDSSKRSSESTMSPTAAVGAGAGAAAGVTGASSRKNEHSVDVLDGGSGSSSSSDKLVKVNEENIGMHHEKGTTARTGSSKQQLSTSSTAAAAAAGDVEEQVGGAGVAVNSALVSEVCSELQLRVRDVRETLEQVGEACHIAVCTLDDLLTFDKLDEKKLEVELDLIDARQFVMDAIRPFRINAQEARINLVVECIAPEYLIGAGAARREAAISALLRPSSPSSVNSDGGNDEYNAQLLEEGRGRSLGASAVGAGANAGNSSTLLRNNSTDGAADVSGDLSLWSSTGYTLLRADKFKLSQVIRNLISNALKFTPAGGTVTVTLQKVSNSKPSVSTIPPTGLLGSSQLLQLSVRDTGAGISKANIKNLFGQYVQFNPNALQKGGGSGLGLWISRSIVELHGGTVRADSPGEGFGTSFIIELPLFTKPPSSNSANSCSDLDLSDTLALNMEQPTAGSAAAAGGGGGYSSSHYGLPVSPSITADALKQLAAVDNANSKILAFSNGGGGAAQTNIISNRTGGPSPRVVIDRSLSVIFSESSFNSDAHLAASDNPYRMDDVSPASVGHHFLDKHAAQNVSFISCPDFDADSAQNLDLSPPTMRSLGVIRDRFNVLGSRRWRLRRLGEKINTSSKQGSKASSRADGDSPKFLENAVTVVSPSAHASTAAATTDQPQQSRFLFDQVKAEPHSQNNPALDSLVGAGIGAGATGRDLGGEVAAAGSNSVLGYLNTASVETVPSLTMISVIGTADDSPQHDSHTKASPGNSTQFSGVAHEGGAEGGVRQQQQTDSSVMNISGTEDSNTSGVSSHLSSSGGLDWSGTGVSVGANINSKHAAVQSPPSSKHAALVTNSPQQRSEEQQQQSQRHQESTEKRSSVPRTLMSYLRMVDSLFHGTAPVDDAAWPAPGATSPGGEDDAARSPSEGSTYLPRQPRYSNVSTGTDVSEGNSLFSHEDDVSSNASPNRPPKQTKRASKVVPFNPEDDFSAGENTTNVRTSQDVDIGNSYPNKLGIAADSPTGGSLLSLASQGRKRHPTSTSNTPNSMPSTTGADRTLEAYHTALQQQQQQRISDGSESLLTFRSVAYAQRPRGESDMSSDCSAVDLATSASAALAIGAGVGGAYIDSPHSPPHTPDGPANSNLAGIMLPSKIAVGDMSAEWEQRRRNHRNNADESGLSSPALFLMPAGGAHTPSRRSSRNDGEGGSLSRRSSRNDGEGGLLSRRSSRNDGEGGLLSRNSSRNDGEQRSTPQRSPTPSSADTRDERAVERKGKGSTSKCSSPNGLKPPLAGEAALAAAAAASASAATYAEDNNCAVMSLVSPPRSRSNSTKSASPGYRVNSSSSSYQPAQSLDWGGEPLKFCVVDDSAANRKMAGRLLTNLGHSVEEVEGGQSFLQLMQVSAQQGVDGASIAQKDAGNDRFDVILMDDNMPGMSGPEATQTIRAAGYKGLIIGVTGDTHAAATQRFLQHGANAVLPKPLQLARLKKEIDDFRNIGGKKVPLQQGKLL